MARKKITANLNGGDAITSMADLVFQLHDASDDSIIATATYAAIGSENTNGTDGANITYTLDVNYDPGSGLLGQIILDGVDIGSVTELKIRCKDESGNESVLSASASFDLALFSITSTNLTESPTGEWETSVSSWGGYGVSDSALIGDFEFEVEYDDRTKHIDCMIGLSEHGVNDPHNGTNRWDIRLYCLTTTDVLQESEMPLTSFAACDNTTPLTFTTGDKLSLRRVGSTIKAYVNETLFHTFTGTWADPMYMHIGPKTTGQFISQPKRK